MLALMMAAAPQAGANELQRLYGLALARDTTLQAAQFQRDALIEARPQAIAQWLPQIAGSASAVHERLGYQTGPSLGSSANDCAISSSADARLQALTDQIPTFAVSRAMVPVATVR